MCKSLFKGLLGATPTMPKPKPPAVVVPTPTTDGNSVVKNPIGSTAGGVFGTSTATRKSGSRVPGLGL